MSIYRDMKFTAREAAAYFEDNECCDIAQFNVKFGQLVSMDSPTHLTQRKWNERADFLQEELDELRKAIAAQDLAEIQDALVDLVYVAKGTAVMAGLPWRDAWDEVHAANMAKVRGQTKRGNLVDVAKPEGWQKPDNERVLSEAGYCRDYFAAWGEAGICEDRCIDDEIHKNGDAE